MNNQKPVYLDGRPAYKKRKQHFKLFFFFLLATFCLTVNAQQTYLKQWMYVPKKITFPSSGAPTSTSMSTSATYPYSGNGIYDANGRIHFYVYGNKVYDSSGTVIFTLPFDPTKNQTEVAIVPFNKVSCSNQYYIFYGLYDVVTSCGCPAKLQGAIVSTDIQTGAISVGNITSTGIGTGTAKTLIASTATDPYDGSTGIAVSKAVGKSFYNYGKRFLYFLSGNSVQRLNLVEPTSANNYTGIGDTQTVVNGSTLSINFKTREADLSPDGTMLAWGEHLYANFTENTTDSSRYHVIYLDPNTGTYTGQYKRISIPKSDIRHGVITFYAKGVEFSSDNQFLFINTGISDTLPTLVDGIYKVQLSNGSKTYLSGSSTYSNSLLEMGSNGKLYVVKGDTLKAIDPSSFVFQSTYDLAVSPQVVDGTGYSGAPLYYNSLPDQIDGENYDPYLYRKYEVSSGLYEVNTTQTWTPDFWGGRDVVRFPGGLKLKAGANILVLGMKLEFGTGTSLEMEPGCSLTVRNSILSAYENLCPGETSGMWQGIKGSSNNPATPIYIDLNTINDTTYGFYQTTIMDALYGARLSGNCVGFNSVKVLYTGNEVDLRFDSMALKNTIVSKINIYYNRFTSDQPLIDQTKGSANGYTDGLKRTKTSLMLNMIDSAFADLQYDTFQGAQYAISSSKSKFKLQYSELKLQKTLSVSLSNTKDTVEISNSYFHHTKSGLTVYTSQAGANIRVIGSLSRFSYIDQYGIQCMRNSRSVIYINQIHFDHCSLAPINLHDNGDWKAATAVPPTPETGNDIRILSNWFDNIPDSKAAIVVSEPAGGNRKYLRFQVNGNAIGQTGGINIGIELNNVIGGNPTGFPGPVKGGYINNQYPVCEVNSNSIALYQTTGWRKGIAANASSQMTFYNNTIWSHPSFKNYWSTGIHISNAQGSLILGNDFAMNNERSGLEANASMMNSNYDCNTFNDCGISVLLTNKHILRNYMQNHGIISTDARQNAFGFLHAWQRGILYDYYATSLNQWVFKTGAALPKISTIPGSGSIVAGYGTDNCGAVLPPAPPSGDFTAIDTLTDPVLNFFDQYYKHRAYLNGDATIPSSNSDIVKVVQAEDYINNAQFSSAQSVLNTISSGSMITSDFKTVYSVYVSSRLADTALTDAQVSTLDSIAKKNSINQSPAAVSARGILWNERYLRYADSADFIYPDMSGYIDSSCTTRTGVPVRILNNSGTVVAETSTGSDGRFLFDASIIAQYDNGQSYRLKVSIPGFPDQYTSYATILDLAYSSDIVFGCGFAKTGSTDPTTTGLVNLQQTHTGIKIYPNPAREFIMIQCTSASNHVRICNVIGETVYEGSIGQQARIDTHNWQKGVYFVYIADNQTNHAVEKIIIH